MQLSLGLMLTPWAGGCGLAHSVAESDEDQRCQHWTSFETRGARWCCLSVSAHVISPCGLNTLYLLRKLQREFS